MNAGDIKRRPIATAPIGVLSTTMLRYLSTIGRPRTLDMLTVMIITGLVMIVITSEIPVMVVGQMLLMENEQVWLVTHGKGV